MKIRNLFRLDKSNNFGLYLALALIFVLLILLISSSLMQSYRLEVRRAKTIANNTNLLINSYFDGTISTVDAVLRGVGMDLIADPKFCSAERKKCAQLIAARLEFAPELADIFYADESGELISSQSSEIKRRVSISERDYFIEHKNNPNSQLIVSKSVKGKLTGAWLITLSRRMTGKNGKFLGVVFGTLRLSAIENFLKVFETGANGSTSIFSADNYTLMVRYPIIENLIGKKIENSPVFKQFKESGVEEGYVNARSALDGVYRINKYRLNKKLGLIIVSSVAESDYLTEWKQRAQITGAAFLFLSIISIYLLYRLIAVQLHLQGTICCIQKKWQY